MEVIPNWHPMFVHFTVALFVAAWLFFMLSTLVATRHGALRTQWHGTGRWTLWLGALVTLGTLLAGWDAYNTVDHDTPSHEAMTEHRNWALVTTGVFALLAAWAAWRACAGRSEGLVFLVTLTLAIALLTATASRGGELVYRYGIGVVALPDTDAHDHAGHDHEHDGNDASANHHDHDMRDEIAPHDHGASAVDAPAHDHDHHDHAH
mgnify:CR=1 FL=1